MLVLCLKELFIQSFKNFALSFQCYKSYITVLNFLLILSLVFSVFFKNFLFFGSGIFIYVFLYILSLFAKKKFLVDAFKKYEEFMKDNIKKEIKDENVSIFALRSNQEKCGLTNKDEKKFLVGADVVFIVLGETYFAIFSECPKFSVFHPEREESHKGCGRKKVCGIPKENYYRYVQEIRYENDAFWIIYNSHGNRNWNFDKIECEKATVSELIKVFREKLRERDKEFQNYEHSLLGE